MRYYSVAVAVLLLCSLAWANALCSSSALWPQPTSGSFGPQSADNRVTLLPGDFAIVQAALKNSSIINSAITRILGVIFPLSIDINTTQLQNVSVLSIEVDRVNDSISSTVDESYTLHIGTAGDARIITASVWGALRALETFSQLVQFHPRSMPPARGGTTTTAASGGIKSASAAADIESLSFYFIECVPITISDSPKYRWRVRDFLSFTLRGAMVDSTRNFVSVNSLKNTLDVMSALKMNVLHWRLSDAYSFPFYSSSLPNISRSAYSPVAAYSPADIKTLVQFGLERGIRVLPEIPMPGRTLSWRDVLPLPMNCTSSFAPSSSSFKLLAEHVAVNPFPDSTYATVNALVQELVSLFPDAFLHIGGDQTQFECWFDLLQSPTQNTQNFTDTQQMHQYFLAKVAEILSGTKVNTTRRTPVLWADVAAVFPSQFGNDAVVQLWQNSTDQGAVIEASTPRPIVSSVGWSLGQPYRVNAPTNSTPKPVLLMLESNRSSMASSDPSLLYPQVITTWPSLEDVYWNEAFVVQGNYVPPLRAFGGELLVWSFDVNSNNWATVWHRMAAVAERLWVGPVPPLSDSTRARLYTRLNDMNCRLARRGLPTVPVLPNTFCEVVTSDTSGGTPPAPPPQIRFVQYGQYRARHLALVGLFMGVFGIMIGATATYCWNSVSARFSQHRTRMQRLRDRELD